LNVPVLLPAFLLFGLLLPNLGSAAQGAATTGRMLVAQVAPTDSDLLLFWEEKDLYVETATRTEKPITQAAENITVITAREIEMMNAHSVDEVLDRVPGLNVGFQGQDFNGTSQLTIQGSSPRNVTVLLDGVVWNSLASGTASTTTIPVQIVERIEIIKGPASSAWGSALGGVVNIITKGTGDTARPQGTISGSFGEANSQDYNAELYGTAGLASYYLHAGAQSSDGLRNNRSFYNDSLYGKISVSPTSDLKLLFTVGYSDPRTYTGVLHAPRFDIDTHLSQSAFFATGAAEYRITPDLSLKGGIQILRSRNDLPTYFITAFPGHLLNKIVYNELTTQANLKLLYTGGMHTATLGLEGSHGNLDQTITMGPDLGGQTEISRPSIDKWAIYANDTLDFGALAVTPGVRVDHDNVTGYFVSPSIGATYELAEHTIARASVARGFTSPPLASTSGGGTFQIPNPGLKSEQGWSYQVGLETSVADYLNLKATLFRNDIKDAISDTTNASGQVVNMGSMVRQGYELGTDTVPLYNLSLRLAHTYTHIHANIGDPTLLSMAPIQDYYTYLVGIKYDDRDSLTSQLTGTYTWWTQQAYELAQYNTFIWDFSINKRFHTGKQTSTELFVNVHNIFSGPYYFVSSYANANRWVEGGIKFRF